ncbi:hypothetical protein T01_2605 [Trichinella spiralis]|uniref:Uncharacterized protein n=1 Tax=Trichinella spiralis TaxID=6334 RepID=A0A0V1B790_TRISP|nr:hypothetical protein T01_2605 [Trichinella spiralis]
MLEAMLEISLFHKSSLHFNHFAVFILFIDKKKSPQEQMTSWDRWKYCNPLLKGVSQSLGQSASQSVNQSRITTPTSFCDTRSAVRIVDYKFKRADLFYKREIAFHKNFKNKAIFE